MLRDDNPTPETEFPVGATAARMLHASAANAAKSAGPDGASTSLAGTSARQPPATPLTGPREPARRNVATEPMVSEACDPCLDDDIEDAAASGGGGFAHREAITLPDASKAALAKAENLLDEHICHLVNLGLRAHGSALNVAFDAETTELLRKAWATAELLAGNAVLPHHLMAAIVVNASAARTVLVEYANETPDRIFAGALLKTGILKAVADRPSIDQIPPSKHLIQWIGAAAAPRATRQLRSGTPVVTTLDLVEVIRNRATDPTTSSLMRRLLREAADAGRVPADLIVTRQWVANANSTLNYFRSDTRTALAASEKMLKSLGAEMQAVNGALNALPANTALQDMLGSVERTVREIGNTQAGRLDDLGRETGEHLTRMTSRLAAIEQRPMPQPTVAAPDLSPILAAVGNLEKKLPPPPAPPSPTGLALAVLAVLALGTTVGLMLAP